MLTDGVFQGIGNDGLVAAYGKLYIMSTASGLPMATYQDSAMTITNTNPVILSASGKAKVFLPPDTYNITLKDVNDNVIWTLNSYSTSGSIVNETQNLFTATEGQTAFNIIYNVGYIDVLVNGVKLRSGTDYTASNGVSVVLAVGCSLNDEVEIIVKAVYEVSTSTAIGSVPFILASIDNLALYDGTYNSLTVMGESEPFAWSATGTVDDIVTFAGASGCWVRQFSGDVKASWSSDFIALVAYCYANSKTLNMDTNATVAANIPHLHDIKYSGWGSITREAKTFYPCGTMGSINTVYVTSTGDDANDGLDSTYPMLSAQRASDIIHNYVYGDVTWKIQLAAETIQTQIYAAKEYPTPNRVQVLGAPVANGVTPTTIVTPPAGFVSGAGIYGSNRCSLYVEDILFSGFKDDVTPTVAGGSSGVTVAKTSDLYTKNVWTYMCDMGIKASHSTLLVEAGVNNANAQGISIISNCTYTVGYNGTAADVTGATGVAITNCTGSGLLVQEGSTGHSDYSYIKNCSNGISVNSRSRVHLAGTTLDGNAVALAGDGNSTWYRNPVIPNTWTGNTVDLLMTGGAMEESFEGTANAVSGYVLRETSNFNTSSATPVTAITKTIPSLFLKNRGAGFDFEMFWNCTGVANTKTVTVKLNGVSIASHVFLATSTQGYCKIKFVNRTNASQQKVFVEWIESPASGAAVVTALLTTAGYTFDFSADMDLTVEHSVTNVADSSRIQHADLRIVH